MTLTIDPRVEPRPRKHAGYGWKPDLPDHRDLLFAAPVERVQNLPPEVDHEPNCPAVYDQGNLGSCTANAIAGAMEFERLKQGLPDFTPSRLFIYFNERKIEGTINSDSGAMLRDGMKVVSRLGAPPENDWPYIETNFSVPPPTSLYPEAKTDSVIRYLRLGQNLQQLKACLADGYPFVFGFTVFDSFESDEVASTGMLNLPVTGEQQLGGHAVMCVGYCDDTQRWKVRNSWGERWGLKGYFYMPYSYLLQANLSSDLWTIRLLASA